jgi:hypothetical protein
MQLSDWFLIRRNIKIALHFFFLIILFLYSTIFLNRKMSELVIKVFDERSRNEKFEVSERKWRKVSEICLPYLFGLVSLERLF